MDEFENWKKIFNGFLKDELYRLREIVSPLNLSIKIVADYQFRSRWFAAYLNSRGAIVVIFAIVTPLRTGLMPGGEDAAYSTNR